MMITCPRCNGEGKVHETKWDWVSCLILLFVSKRNRECVMNGHEYEQDDYYCSRCGKETEPTMGSI